MTEYLSKKITILSFLAILIVVLLHAYNLDTLFKGQPLVMPKGVNWYVQNFFSNGLTRIAVPMFFVISGYLFFLKFELTFADYSIKVGKRIKTLFVPYVLWSFLGIVLYFTLQSVPQSAVFFSNGLIRDFTFPQLLDRLFLHPIPYQFWFIRDLMLFVVCAPLVFLLVKYTKGFILLPLVATWAINFDFVILSNEALLYFFAGAYIAIENKKLLTADFSNKALLLTLIWIIAVASKVTLEFLGHEQELLTLLVFKFSIAIGLLAAWALYDLNQKNKPAVPSHSIFKLSFFIYAIHEPMLTIIKKVLFTVLGTEEMQCLLIYAIAPAIAIGIAIAAGLLMKRYLTKIYNILTGDR